MTSVQPMALWKGKKRGIRVKQVTFPNGSTLPVDALYRDDFTLDFVDRALKLEEEASYTAID